MARTASSKGLRAPSLAFLIVLAAASAGAVPTTAATGAATASGATLEGFKFEQKDGVTRIVLSVRGLVRTEVVKLPSGKTRLELAGMRVQNRVAKVYDVAAFQAGLKEVAVYQDKDRSAALVEVDLPSTGRVEVSGETVTWYLQESRSNLRGGAAATVAREGKLDGGPMIARSTAELAVSGETAASSTTAGTSAKYTGRRINMDLKDADIHNILRLLADVGKVNIVTADDVAGSVTIRMQDVPWDQILDIVLQTKGLGMIRGGNLIRVAPLATLQKEREMRLAAQKQEFELTPLETRLIPVSYASASELQPRAKELISARGSISVDERTNVLIARDIGPNLNFVEELVRSLDTQTPQVLIEARIVEATSKFSREVGIQWGGDATFSEATGNPTGLGFPSRVTLAGGARGGSNVDGLNPGTTPSTTPNFAVNLPAAAGAGAGGALGITLGSLDGTFNLPIRLSAAEASGMARIVSSPRILALDNRSARISKSTMIPYSQVSAQGVQTQFREAKLALEVKPHVTADGSVAMHVMVNRDEPDTSNKGPRGELAILKREAETDLLVADGHTAVIGGIYTRRTGKSLAQVPILGDIPILGALFQTRGSTDDREELVIFLTPRIVNRAESLGR